MQNPRLKEIHNLSRNGKIKLVQKLWDEIAEEQESLKVPKEHIKLLRKRIEKLDNGTLKTKNWDEVKRKYFP